MFSSGKTRTLLARLRSFQVNNSYNITINTMYQLELVLSSWILWQMGVFHHEPDPSYASSRNIPAPNATSDTQPRTGDGVAWTRHW